MNQETETTESFAGQLKRRTAPFFGKVGGLSRSQRILISLVSFGVLIGGYVYFMYLPRQEEKSRLDQQASELNALLATYRTKAASLAKYEALMEEAQGRFNIAMNQLPDNREIPSLLTGISRSGNDAGLEFLLFQPMSEVQQTYYAEIPVSIKVLGGYHQVAGFFDRVARLNRIVNIKDISMSQSKEKDSVQLETVCSAVTYMFVEKKIEEPKGAKKK
ncbi:MAG: type 4a pilus biogenesis protein PilO [Pseudomonadota bacterium]